MHRTFTVFGFLLVMAAQLAMVAWIGTTARQLASQGQMAQAGFLLLLCAPFGFGLWHMARLSLRLFRGGSSSRLVARDFRNLVANCFFFVQSGGWKE